MTEFWVSTSIFHWKKNYFILIRIDFLNTLYVASYISLYLGFVGSKEHTIARRNIVTEKLDDILCSILLLNSRTVYNDIYICARIYFFIYIYGMFIHKLVCNDNLPQPFNFTFSPENRSVLD